jgi:pyruvate kinase
MAVARVNASHGETADQRQMIERVHRVDATTEQTVATMLDLAGPEVRTGTVANPVPLEAGGSITLEPGSSVTADRIGLSISLGACEPGDTIFLDDGRIETTVESVSGEAVHVTVADGGTLRSRAGVNVPGVDLGLPAVTDDDKATLEMASAVEPDFIAASFIKECGAIYELEAAMDERGVAAPIIAKIERREALDSLDGIIDAAYGIMVARGDLGVECPLEDVPMIQKQVIRRCNENGVTVITATEMLDSMIHERRPTRAEASDVANAVLDGTDAVMLSGETAVGENPIAVVETMARIIADVESSTEYETTLEQRVPAAGATKTDALARSARFLARDVDASAIITATESGYTARKAAMYRPTIPIVVATPNDPVRRRLAMTWGCQPIPTTDRVNDANAIIRSAVQATLDAEFARSGDTVVVMTGMMSALDGQDTSNTLKVHVAADRLTSGRGVVSGRVSGPVYPVTDGDIEPMPDGAIVTVPAGFEGEFSGPNDGIAGIIDGHGGMTSYAAIVARELGVPAVADATLPLDVPPGTRVRLDGDRGIVYEELEA